MHRFQRSDALIIHPEVHRLLAAIAKLRESLADAIRRMTYLQEVEGPRLRALYQQELGEIQLSVLEILAAYLSNKLKYEAMMARLNRDEPITPKWLDSLEREVEEKLFEYRSEIRRQKLDMEQAHAFLASLHPADPQRQAAIKRIYHRLCRALHPDLGQADPALTEAWWPEVQRAYASGDLEQLESIALVLNLDDDASAHVDRSNSAQETPGRLAALRAEETRLRSCLREKLDAQKSLRELVPFVYADQLHDPNLMEAKRRELQEQYDIFAAQNHYLSTLINDLVRVYDLRQS